MQAIKINTPVMDAVGNIYENSLVAIDFPTQIGIKIENNQPNSPQYHFVPYSSMNEAIERADVFVIGIFPTKDIDTLKKRRSFQLFTVDDNPILPPFVKLSSEEKKHFGIEILTQKTVEYFQGIFGEKNVEMLHNV
jgi:hypothetical protein